MDVGIRLCSLLSVSRRKVAAKTHKVFQEHKATVAVCEMQIDHPWLQIPSPILQFVAPGDLNCTRAAKKAGKAQK